MKILRAPPKLPPRPPDVNKVTAGRVLVVGGSRDMAGAPAMAALGALRAGAGLVRIAVPASIQALVASFRPETTSLGLAETRDGGLASSGIEVLREMYEAWDALVLGPGAGRAAAALALVRRVAKTTPQALVLDADGLFAFNDMADTLTERSAPTVLTPHEGEAARLLGLTSEAVRADREGTAARLATTSKAIVVLKGPGTVVTDGAQLYRNRSGGPALATGGTGDVLAGAIGALLARHAADRLTPFQAACAGVYVHGLAADHLAQDYGVDRGLLATEIADEIPEALASLVSKPVRRPTT